MSKSNALSPSSYTLTENIITRNNGYTNDDGHGPPLKYRDALNNFKFKKNNNSTCSRPGFVPFTGEKGFLTSNARNNGIKEPTPQKPIFMFILWCGQNIAALAICTVHTKNAYRTSVHSNASSRVADQSNNNTNIEIHLDYLCAAQKYRRAGTILLIHTLNTKFYNEKQFYPDSMYLLDDTEQKTLQGFYTRLGFQNTKQTQKMGTLEGTGTRNLMWKTKIMQLPTNMLLQNQPVHHHHSHKNGTLNKDIEWFIPGEPDYSSVYKTSGCPTTKYIAKNNLKLLRMNDLHTHLLLARNMPSKLSKSFYTNFKTVFRQGKETNRFKANKELAKSIKNHEKYKQYNGWSHGMMKTGTRNNSSTFPPEVMLFEYENKLQAKKTVPNSANKSRSKRHSGRDSISQQQSPLRKIRKHAK